MNEPEKFIRLARVATTFEGPSLLGKKSQQIYAPSRGDAEKARRLLGNDYIQFLGEKIRDHFKIDVAFTRGPTREGSSIFGNIQIYVDGVEFLTGALLISQIAYNGSRTLNEMREFFDKTPMARHAVIATFLKLQHYIIVLTQLFAKARQINVSYIEVKPINRKLIKTNQTRKITWKG